MPTQKQIEWENTVSKNYQAARRESNVNKESGGIFDVETGYYKPLEPNEQTGRRNIQDDGVDAVNRDRALNNRLESDGGGGGGGVPEGFAEETLDVVNANNTAGQRVFLTKAV